jgi:ribosomal protein S6
VEYELLFFTTVANEDKIELIKKELIEILTSLGAKLSSEFTDIGKRKLAHPIKRNTHAFFSFTRFELEERQNIPEINKRINLYDKVMRHIIVRADEIGKPVGAVDLKPEEAIKEKPVKQERPAEPAAQEKVEEAKPKTALSDLDEKLSEILEETPSQ